MALLLAAGADAGRRGAAGLSAADYAAGCAAGCTADYAAGCAADCAAVCAADRADTAATPPWLVAEVMLPASPGHPGAGTTVVDGGIDPLTLMTLAP